MSFYYLYILAGSLAIVSTVLGLLRLIQGPHPLDRILSLDYLGFVGVNICVVSAAIFNNELLLDLAVTFALVCFVTALISSKIVSIVRGIR